ncbi:MAG: hypothetical protein KAR87_05635 [Candidatus Aenigmarchaeota archaeon]|nr:hypothetical protein [Candidatus Aenigmarchaeota archaeon]
MKAKNTRFIINGLIILFSLFAGWSIYAKQPNVLIISIIIVGLLAVVEETIIKWFK